MTQQISTDRYDLLQWFEGRWIRVLHHERIGGELIATERWRQVIDGKVQGQYAVIDLAQHVGLLETLARESISQIEYERWYCDQQISLEKMRG